MDRLLSELTDWLIHNHAISSDDKEFRKYLPATYLKLTLFILKGDMYYEKI